MLKNIEIIDYKCFKNFKLEGLSQINIISGGNNVGKTALLEAFLLENIGFNEKIGSSAIVYFLTVIAKNRDIHTKQFKRFAEDMSYKMSSNNYTVEFKVKNHRELSKEELIIINKLNADYSQFLFSKINDEIDLIPIDNIKMKETEHGYINSSKPTNQELVKKYSKIQTKGIQHKFLKYLKVLDDNIEYLEPQMLGDELLLRVNLKEPEHSLISSELGEGTNRYIEILTILLDSDKKRVYIDEIENGLHYSKLKDIFKAIIEIVQKQDIQLFVTTHDEDTIKALVEASEEMEYKDVASIRLIKDENNKIVPIVKQFENFAYGINRGADVR